MITAFLWEEQDSNLRRFPNGFTVRPRWPLEYLPDPCGERGIRTPGPVTVNGFQDRRIRPLCHFSFAICFSELASANIGGFFISANTFGYKNDFFIQDNFFQAQ